MAVHILEHTAPIVAAKLMEIGAIRLNHEKPFTWSSGWKSPVYCDNRLSLSYPPIRSLVKDSLAEAVKQRFWPADLIAGVATAGIPQGALVADALQLPFAYVRPKPKDHGLENLIEGRIEPGQQVVVVEDLISTGGSSLKAVKAIRDAGGIVKGMVAIFTYGFEEAANNFAAQQVELVCLSSFTHLIAEARRLQTIPESQMARLSEWRRDPANWK